MCDVLALNLHPKIVFYSVCSGGTFHKGKVRGGGGSLKVTTYLHLLPRLKMSEDIPSVCTDLQNNFTLLLPEDNTSQGT